VAKLFQTLFRGKSSQPSNAISRYDVSWLLQQLNSPYAISASSATQRNGRQVEDVENAFVGYVQQGYKSNGVLFAIILARLLLFSEARFQYRRLIKGKPGELFGAENGELDLLAHPWPNGTTGELLGRMEQDVSLAGNFYAVNAGDRLRRLRPDWVSIVLSGDPTVDAEVDVQGYAYSPGGVGNSEMELYLPGEVCHWSPIPDPEAMYRGMSWVTPVVRELQADDAATQHKNAFFRNGAKPGLVVSLKESVREEQFKKFVRAMNDSHNGSDSAYKTLFLAGGAEVTVAGSDLRQLDFRATQGAGETRLCAAGGVPPIIVGLSEGLQAATYSNYASARRKFGDHWARPQWRSACAALASITEVPDDAELWYDDRDISFLREDQKDAATIQQTNAATINTLITAGFTAQSSVAAVTNGDMTLLVHSGMVSVQLQPPGAGVPEEDPALAGETPAEDEPALTEAMVGEGEDAARARFDFRDYWLTGKGAARWSTWEELAGLLKRHLPPASAKRIARQWFKERYGTDPAEA
jgi:phage portal protein BeeE